MTTSCLCSWLLWHTNNYQVLLTILLHPITPHVCHLDELQCLIESESFYCDELVCMKHLHLKNVPTGASVDIDNELLLFVKQS